MVGKKDSYSEKLDFELEPHSPITHAMNQRLPFFSFYFLSILMGLLRFQALADASLEVRDPSGEIHRARSPEGQIEKDYPPQSTRPSFLLAPSASAEEASPLVERVEFVDSASGRSVDPEGNVSGPADTAAAARAESTAPTQQAQAEEVEAVQAEALVTERVTIDQMTFGVTYSETYSPTTGLVVFGPAREYQLSDGTKWPSGAGTYYRPRAVFDHSEIDRTNRSRIIIRYYFQPPAEGYLYKQTDYNSGDHSSNGSLGAAGPLVLEAVAGATTGTMKGDVEILTNIPANYSEPRFNYWSAPVGAIVPFEATFTLLNGASFTETTFDSAFSYSNAGVVDFADPTSIPPLTEVRIMGSAQVRPNSKTQFYAVATYESGAQENVTAKATWTVTPTDIASIEEGLLTADTGADGATLELRATFTSGETAKTGIRTVLCREIAPDEWAAYWETYQADERHSGSIPISLEPEVFTLRWKREIAPGRALNPVAAADGKVFVSLKTYFNGGDALFALDARDGETLWSRDFGSPFSINPPAYGYGNVYIQTGNHSNDTYLWAFDADSGDLVFQSPHSAQWERYYAPTVYDGNVYVNGGYYGGMYAFDAFTGANLWFADLPQYDQFTPAVDEEHVYAYVGEYAPALYVVDRETGSPVYQIADPNFDWNGWSMNLAPVLGGMDDIIAVHDGRLIRFDLAKRSIGYEIAETFTGQPSVAKGVIYAINGGSVEARQEASGAMLWKWTPGAGAATEHLIVTDSHVIARTQTDTYAIELLSGESVWSYPVAGSMAIGEETLYIASADGVLTAISIPEYTPAIPVEIEIAGPAEAHEFGSATYTAWVRYDDGRVRDRTKLTEWSVAPSDYASIDEFGELSVNEMLVPAQTVSVKAVYREGEVQLEDDVSVSLEISVPLNKFVRRNLEAALAEKRKALEALIEAERREEAAILVVDEGNRALRQRRDQLVETLNRLRKAEFWTVKGQEAIEKGSVPLREEMGVE